MSNLLSELEMIDGDSAYYATIFDESAHNKIDTANARIDTLDSNVNARIDTLDSNVNARIDTVNTRVDNINTELSNINYVNAIDAGIIPSNATENIRSNNTSILNTLLSQGKFVYFPNNSYFFNDTIHINKHCGIVGQSMDGVVFNTNTLNDGILVDIDVQGQIYDNVWNTFVLKDFHIHCDAYPNSNGAGIRLRNYTWEVTANYDTARYIELKGDAYALEIRNSVCQNIHITCFKNGLESGYYISYGYFNNFFIDTCTEYGVYNKCSDSIYANFVITFCYHGFYEQCEENKFCNICIKQNGRRYAFDETHTVGGSIGLWCVGSRQDTFCNLELQENGATGSIIDRCHDMIFSNVVVDANGFNPLNRDTHDSGIDFANECYNIFGNITATNKNTPDNTQKLGMYVDDACHDMFIKYQESNQRVKIYQIDNRRTIGSLTNTFLNRVNTIVSDDFVPATHAIARYDGHNITIDIQGYYNAAKAANTTLFQWGGIFGTDINPSVYTSYYLSGNINVMITNFTDGTFIKAHISEVQELICDEPIPAGKQLALSITLPVWLNYD